MARLDTQVHRNTADIARLGDEVARILEELEVLRAAQTEARKEDPKGEAPAGEEETDALGRPWGTYVDAPRSEDNPRRGLGFDDRCWWCGRQIPVIHPNATTGDPMGTFYRNEEGTFCNIDHAVAWREYKESADPDPQWFLHRAKLAISVAAKDHFGQHVPVKVVLTNDPQGVAIVVDRSAACDVCHNIIGLSQNHIVMPVSGTYRHVKCQPGFEHTE